jgi:hypothetical protein
LVRLSLTNLVGQAEPDESLRNCTTSWEGRATALVDSPLFGLKGFISGHELQRFNLGFAGL